MTYGGTAPANIVPTLHSSRTLRTSSLPAHQSTGCQAMGEIALIGMAPAIANADGATVFIGNQRVRLP
jgi:hypothetical protein